MMVTYPNRVPIRNNLLQKPKMFRSLVIIVQLNRAHVSPRLGRPLLAKDLFQLRLCRHFGQRGLLLELFVLKIAIGLVHLVSDCVPRCCAAEQIVSI